MLQIFWKGANKGAPWRSSAAEYMLPRLTTFLTTGAGMDSRSGGKGRVEAPT